MAFAIFPIFLILWCFMFEFIENLSYKIGNYIGRDEQEEDREIYRYSIFAILSTLFEDLFGLIVASIFNCTFQYLIIVFVYSVLRCGMGGYHADTFKKCFITTNCVFLLSTFFASVTQSIYLPLFYFSIILGVWILPYCPKPSKNSPSRGYSEDIRFRKMYRNRFIIFQIINFASLYFGCYNISLSISWAIIVCWFVTSDFGEGLLTKIMNK